MKTYNVAILGSTGAVGQEMIKVLEERNFPVKELRPLASQRSVGKKYYLKDRKLMCSSHVRKLLRVWISC